MFGTVFILNLSVDHFLITVNNVLL